MADADLDYEGIKELIAGIVADLGVPLRAVSMGIAAEAQNRIAPYPSPSRKRQAFKTLKQRRGFFAKLRSGKIKVPYPRSGDTLARWAIIPTAVGADLVNTSRHAKWVHSSSKQAGYHSGNWQTDKGVANKIVSDGTAATMIEQALQAHFDKQFGG